MTRHTVLGTGGHIDHGKTALVKALTGTDTDRLREEKERGITIELGFAFLGDDVTIIDVPGHEKFVRTMVAGVSTIDVALLVIAADDGVMPQTIEHLDVLRYLNVRCGMVAVTKTDLVESDWLALVIEDVKQLTRGTFLEGCAIVPTSSVTGEGVDAVRDEIRRLVDQVPTRSSEHVFRFPVDRAFSMKGFGTVVTGTVLSGHVRVGDHLVLQPYQKEVRVRGLQVHESETQEAFPGQRVGINVADAGKDEITRGAVLVAPGYYKPTYMLDVRLFVSEHAKAPVEHWQRVRFHIGTSELLARVVPLEGERILPGGSGLAQLRLEGATIAECHDRFVLRQYAPMVTLGGGEVLEPYPQKHKTLSPEGQAHLERLAAGDPYRQIEAVFAARPLTPLRFREVEEGARMRQDLARELVDGLVAQGRLRALQGKNETFYLRATDLAGFQGRLLDYLSERLGQYPFLEGIEVNELKEGLKLTLTAPHVELLLSTLEAEGAVVRRGTQWAPPGHVPEVSEAQRAILDQMLAAFERPGFGTELDAGFFKQFAVDEALARRLFALLESRCQVIHLGEGLYISKADYERGVQVVRALGRDEEEIRVGDVRARLETTRKFAMPFMQYLDSHGITLRAGDRRVLREGA